MDTLSKLFKTTEKPMTRRAALRAAACGFGHLGLADLLAAAARPEIRSRPRRRTSRRRRSASSFLFMHGGAVQHRHLRSEGALYTRSRQAAADQASARLRRRAAGPLMKPPWDFKQHGQSGIPVSDLFPQCRDVRRRPVHHPLDGRRGRRSRRGAAADLHRHEHVRASEHGLVDRLRTRHREPESARLHHDQADALARRRRRTGARPFCRARIRARRSATPA